MVMDFLSFVYKIQMFTWYLRCGYSDTVLPALLIRE